MTLPATMRAVVGPVAGPISTLKVASNLPVPTSAPPAGVPELPSVVVKTEFAALNPIDWKMMEFGMLIEKWPYAFGCDISGEVVEAGEGADFKPGDKVWAFTLLGEGVQGAAFAEYVRVPAVMLGLVPSAVSMEAASTLGLSTLTAALGIYKCLGLPVEAPADSTAVLVYGASSSTGVSVVSLLKNSGYRVVAVASKQHHEWLKDTVGASQVVNYKDSDWIEQIAADPANAGLKHAVDCIAKTPKGDFTATLGEKDASNELTGTLSMCDQVIRKCGSGDDGAISTVNPFAKGDGKRTVSPISTILTTAEDIKGAREYVELAETLLEQGKLITMPMDVIGGLDAVPEGLQMLKDGKVSRTKLVVKI